MLVRMVPVNAVTAISLAARSEDCTIKLTAPCTLVVEVDMETEDGLPVPFEAACEGLSVKLALPGLKRSKAVRLEPCSPGQNSEGSPIAFISEELTTAGVSQMAVCP